MVEAHVEKGNRAADRLFRQFAKMIQTGELKDGHPLPTEREIVDTFGVSRTVVREAILALSNKGLVEARPRHRPVVKKPSFDTALSTIESLVFQLLNEREGVKNLFDTRIMVEVSLVRHMATQATRQDLEALKKALVENGKSIHDSERFYETDKQFHGVLFNSSQNPVISSLHKAYTSWLAPYWSKMPRLPERNMRNYQAHEAILEAIKMRDPDAAEKATRKHLNAAWEQIKLTFAAEFGDSE